MKPETAAEPPRITCVILGRPGVEPGIRGSEGRELPYTPTYLKG